MSSPSATSTRWARRLRADAEIIWTVYAGLEALGVEQFRFLINSRQALHGLLKSYGIAAELGTQVLGSLDKLDKATPDAVTAELVQRGLTTDTAERLVTDLTTPDIDRVRKQLDTTERGQLGLAEVDRLLNLTAGLPADQVVFTPRMVRGLDYYTGPIFEVEASGYPGSIASGGRYDGLIAQLGGPDLPGTWNRASRRRYRSPTPRTLCALGCLDRVDAHQQVVALHLAGGRASQDRRGIA